MSAHHGYSRRSGYRALVTARVSVAPRTFTAEAQTTRAIIAAHRAAHAYAQAASCAAKVTLLRVDAGTFRVIEDSKWTGTASEGRWLATYYGGRRFDGYRIAGDEPQQATAARKVRP